MLASSQADMGFELANWTMSGPIFSYNCWKNIILISGAHPQQSKSFSRSWIELSRDLKKLD
jgi:hypothetical protein